MRRPIYEEPIVPVFVDIEEEVQYYYSSADSLFAGYQPPNPYYAPSAPQQWQPQNPPSAPQNTWGGQAPYPAPSTSPYPQYPPAPNQQLYPTAWDPGYQGNQYSANYMAPQPQSHYGAPTQPANYGNYAQPGYPTPQYGWPGYGQPTPGYPQPAPGQYQPGYPPYQAYPQAPGQGGYYNPQPQAPPQQPGNTNMISAASSTLEASAPADEQSHESRPAQFGWNETLFGDFGFDNYTPAPSTTRSSLYEGRSLVNETVTPSQYSTNNAEDHYIKQFERLQIGWNI